MDGISYFFFHGNRFVQRLDLIKEAPGDRIRSSSKFIMPWDKGGKANSILVFDKVTETVMDSKGQRKSRSHRMMWSYYWDGRRFRESKKVPLKK